MKRTLWSFICLISALSFCGCCLMYEYINNAVDSFDVGYSDFMDEAFLACYNWDGNSDNMSIEVPEAYKGTPIIGLGGYTGRGVPAPFSISLTDTAKNTLCPQAAQWTYANHTANIENYTFEKFAFKLHVSKNIKEIENLSMGGIIVAEYEEKGEKKHTVYVLTCNVTCDENNKTFYSKEGKLYYKKDNKLVEDIVYEDFDLEKHNEKHKNSVVFHSVF